MNEEDKSILEELKALAETDNGRVFVVYEEPTAVAITMTYRELYQIFNAVLNRHVEGNTPEDSIDELVKKYPEARPLKHLRDTYKGTAGHHFMWKGVSIVLPKEKIVEVYRGLVRSRINLPEPREVGE